MIKAIFFDIDGTLISFKTHKLPESTKTALQMLREKGIKLFVATGRPLKNVDFLKAMFEFDGYVTMNGQYCCYGSDIIHEATISTESLRTLLPYLQEHSIACSVVELNYNYINLINDKVLGVYELLGNTLELEPIEDMSRALCNKVYQLSPYIDEADEAEFLRHLPGCKAARWCAPFTDIIPSDGGKEIGIEAMLAHCGMTVDEAMAFGDGGNDVTMLQHIKMSVAMGNAEDKVKAAASYVTDDIDNDGIYKALRHFNII